MNTLLLSIHPQHAQQILAGTKTVELRRTAPKKHPRRLVIYETDPTQAIVGWADVVAMDVASPLYVWKKHQKALPTTDREAFEAYFEGSPHAVALVLGKVMLPKRPIRLDEIGVGHAPQGLRYLTKEEQAALADLMPF